MIKFRQKDFSHYVVSDAIKGAALGGTILGGGVGLLGEGRPINISGLKVSESGKAPSFRKGWNQAISDLSNHDFKKEDIYKDGNKVGTRKVQKVDTNYQRALGTGAGIIIGGALGALVGAIKDISTKISQNNNKYGYLTNGVAKELKKYGLKEDVDFTMNSKVADKLGSKICFVITRNGEGLRILVNLKNDPRLSDVAKKVTKQLSTRANVRHQSASDRYNEIMISTASGTKSTDIVFISELIENFTAAGYPVYIVEVG